MDLSSVFHSSVDVAFNIFEPLTRAAHYIVPPVSSGWDDSVAATEKSIKVIVNGLSQDDLRNTSFFAQMEPTDTVVMVKGRELTSQSIRVRNSDTIRIYHVSYTQLYEVKAHETDPAEALFLILLREK